MCLLVFAFRAHPDFPLIFAGNRDEFHERPTVPAHFWEDVPALLAGRDLKGGGTWLGITRTGRFATVTNFREPGDHRPDARSRGELVTGFLQREIDGREYVEQIHGRAEAYNGFNLILGDARQLYYLSNRDGSPRALGAGVYGLSNGWLDTPWPKVRRARSLFEHILRSETVAPETLLNLLADDRRPSDEMLPRTGLDLKVERKISSIFIADARYGTRSSTVVLLGRDGVATFVERSFGPEAEPLGTVSFGFSVDGPSTCEAT